MWHYLASSSWCICCFLWLFVIKYIDYGAILNMGIVISILEENKHGDVASGVSAYISGGSRNRRFLIMLELFAWSFGLRLSSLCVGWQKECDDWSHCWASLFGLLEECEVGGFCDLFLIVKSDFYRRSLMDQQRRKLWIATP